MDILGWEIKWKDKVKTIDEGIDDAIMNELGNLNRTAVGSSASSTVVVNIKELYNMRIQEQKRKDENRLKVLGYAVDGAKCVAAVKSTTKWLDSIMKFEEEGHLIRTKASQLILPRIDLLKMFKMF